jgi:hypothetical protein
MLKSSLKKENTSTGSKDTTQCEIKTEKQVDWKDMQLYFYMLTFPPLGTQFQKNFQKFTKNSKNRENRTKEIGKTENRKIKTRKFSTLIQRHTKKNSACQNMSHYRPHIDTINDPSKSKKSSEIKINQR